MKTTQSQATKLLQFAAYTLFSVLLLILLLFYTNHSTPKYLSDFKQSGALHIHGASGAVESSGEVQAIKYNLPPRGVIGSWTKTSTDIISPENSYLVNIELNFEDVFQNKDVAVFIEFKGDKAIQKSAVPLKGGFFQLSESIDWQRIGNLTEVVFLIHNTNPQQRITGNAELKLTFTELSTFEKLLLSVKGKILLLTALSALCAAFFYLFGLALRIKESNSKNPTDSLGRDILFALSITIMVGITFMAYAIGDIPLLERSKLLYIIPMASVLLGALLKLHFTDRSTTAFENFRNAFFPGFLAITATDASIWLMPTSWVEVFSTGCLGTATFVFLYHIGNIYRLCIARKQLGFAGSFFLISTPYIMGILLALQNQSLLVGFIDFNTNLLNEISKITSLTTGDFSKISSSVIAFGIMFLITEFICNAFSILDGKRLIIDFNAHKKIAILSLGLIIAPFIADIGSGIFAGQLPTLMRSSLAVITTSISQGMLWAYVFMITGVMLDAISGDAPAAWRIHLHARKGRNSGMMYSGILMALIQIVYLFCHAGFTEAFYNFASYPLLILTGAAVFPLAKTIIETFDGSTAFFTRAKRSYKNPALYIRGAVAGLALAIAITIDIETYVEIPRIIYGLAAGAIVFGGISFILDRFDIGPEKAESKSWRRYLLESGMGGFIGAAICFYLDAHQISVITHRFNEYNVFANEPKQYSFYNLISIWGNITLSDYQGGSKLLYNQALNGVIAWGVAAWLFALNNAMLKAIFSRDMVYIKRIATREGMIELAEGTIRVLRWGLWMSPIIFTCLKQVDDPAWYNQDGAIRTVCATFNSITMNPEAFNHWSVKVFMWVMAYDFFRIIIWIDHMGLRVASLVNLSFIGMETLDSRFVRFVNKSGSIVRSVIPEGVQRFMTWAPLLIPYYIPAGEYWTYALGESVKIKAATPAYVTMLFRERLDIIIISLVTFFVLLAIFVILKRHYRTHSLGLSNSQYKVGINEKTGVIRTSMFAIHCSIDVTRRNYSDFNTQTPTLYLFDVTNPLDVTRYKLFGDFRDSPKNKPSITREGESLKICGSNKVVKYEIYFSIPVKSDQVAFIDVSLKSITTSERKFKLVPYFEWSLDRTSEDKARLADNRESQEMIIEPGSNALYCYQPTKGMVSFIASEAAPEGYIRRKSSFDADFENADLSNCNFEPGVKSREWFPDPAGALLVGMSLEPKETKKTRFVTGCAFYEAEAVNFVKSYLKPVVSGENNG